MILGSCHARSSREGEESKGDSHTLILLIERLGNPVARLLDRGVLLLLLGDLLRDVALAVAAAPAFVAVVSTACVGKLVAE